MFRKRFSFILHNSVLFNLSSFSLVLFFILLGDALLSFWVPNFLQDTLKSPFLMGLTMSFSSIIGFAADIIFPQALRGYTVRKLLFSAIISGFAFIVCLALGVSYPVLAVLLLAMAIWGVYYEFLGFASQQFVADSIPLKLRSSGWAIIGIFRNLAYLIGPLIAGALLLKGEHMFLMTALVIVSVGYLIFIISHRKHERVITIDVAEVNIWKEISHWQTLFKKVWPVLLLSLMLGLIDATFWTTGAVWTENLSDTNFWGAFLLPAYQLPSLFMGMVVYRWGVYKGKKKLAEKFLLLAGLTLCLLIFNTSIPVYVFIVFIASMFLSVSFPLVEAVYSDITSRMGVERKHLVGVSSSTTSLAYIISPAVAGFIAESVGEQTTFFVIGLIAVFTALVLLAVTPKKIHLPEAEIKSWKD